MNFPKQPHPLLRVNLGCGHSPTPGWVNFDSSPSVWLARILQAPILLSWASGWLLTRYQLAFVECIRNYAIAYGDGIKGLPLASGSCRVVYASHVLEHLAAPQVHVFLKEVFRILAPSGILRLAVPDLQIYIDAYQSSSDADQLIHGLNFFPPDQQGRLRRWLSSLSGNRTLYQWVYNDVSLGRTLVGSGFVNPIKLEPGETTIPDSGLLNLCERAW